MDTQHPIQAGASSAIAPEDLSAGCYIAVLHVIAEHMPFGCDEDYFKNHSEPARIRWLPALGCPPMKVIDICLPFVLVRQPNGKVRTLDVRRHRLARLSDSYGRRAFRAFKAADKVKETRSSDKKEDKESTAGEANDDQKE